MSGLFAKFMEWLKSLFWKQEMEITLVGLQGAGKTTLLSAISDGPVAAEKDTIPTIGLNTKKVTKGSVTIKLWDIGGQPRFRPMWERYCRGVNSIVYVVDASDPSGFDTSRQCLQDLINKPALEKIPLLVLANKNDVPGSADQNTVALALGLNTISDREVTCYSISAKRSTNIDATLKWLTAHAGKKATPSQ
jgi:ADP-ribosylation factor-like protein 8